MKRRLALLAFVATTTGAVAETIHFKNGRRLDGEIVSREQGKVTIRYGGAVMSVNEADIARIEGGEAWQPPLLRARAALRGGQCLSGVETLLDALKQGAPGDEIERVVKDSSLALLNGANRLPPEDTKPFREGILALAASDRVTTGTKFLGAQILHQAEDRDGVLAVLRGIGPDWFAERPRELEWSRRMIETDIRRLAGAGAYDGALERIEFLDYLIPGAGGERALPAMLLARSAAARREGNLIGALRIVIDDLAPLSPEIARNRASQMIGEIRYRALDSGRHREGREALAGALERYPVEAYAAWLDLLEAEAQRAIDAGDHAAALTLAGQVPQAEQTELLRTIALRAEYLRRLAELPPGDPLALFRLGQWCGENDLLDEAIHTFAETRRNEALRAVSDDETRLLVARRDAKLLEQALALYDEGRLTEVLERTEKILLNPDRKSAVNDEALRLDALVRKEMKTDTKRRPYLAEVFYQNAEREYYQGMMDEALETTLMILKQFGDTPAANRAQALLPDILRSLELAYVEGSRETLPPIDFDISAAALKRATALDEEIRNLLAGILPPESPRSR